MHAPDMKVCAVEESGSFGIRAKRFLSDSRADVLTGERRKGREATLLQVMGIAEEEGYAVSLYPDVRPGSKMLFFLDWVGNSEEMQKMYRKFPDITIFYGQDLCHQVPAVVRFRPFK